MGDLSQTRDLASLTSLIGSNMFVRHAPAMLAVLSLAACAPQPDQVAGTYISPATYSSYSCSQLVSSARRFEAARAAVQSSNSRAISDGKVAARVAPSLGSAAVPGAAMRCEGHSQFRLTRSATAVRTAIIRRRALASNENYLVKYLTKRRFMGQVR